MPGHGIGLGFLVRRPDRLLVGSAGAGAGAGWSGVGIVLIFRISLIGWFILRQVLDLAAMPGMARVICRVPVILPFSRSTVH